MSKRIASKNSSGANCSLKNDWDLFARYLLESHEILTPKSSFHMLSKQLPSLLPTSMVKTDKAKLMRAIEESVPNPVVSEVPAPNALVVDAMALLQQLTKCAANTFDDLADEILSILIGMAKCHQSTRVDFVGELYPKAGTKGTERERRANAGAQVVRIYGR